MHSVPRTTITSGAGGAGHRIGIPGSPEECGGRHAVPIVGSPCAVVRSRGEVDGRLSAMQPHLHCDRELGIPKKSVEPKGRVPMPLRSAEWFKGAVDNTFQHRMSLKAMGRDPDQATDRPVIGIANSWSDLNNCNFPLKKLAEDVKRGVLRAGGFPVEFHTITTAADFMKPSDLLYRNLMAMDVEEMVRAHPIDGVVLLCECDKTIPAQLMAAASLDIPAIQVAAGHRASGCFMGSRVTYATDFWHYLNEYKAGRLSDEEWAELESVMSMSPGGCAVMGSASTMKILSEVLGMMMPGSSDIPSVSSERAAAAEAAGQRIVEMVIDDIRPSQLMTEPAFDNAIRVLAAIGGSTNAIIHLTAIARRFAYQLDLSRFETLFSDVPVIVNLQPSGDHNMDDLHDAGGTRAVVGELLPILDDTCLTASGQSLADAYGNSPVRDRAVVRSLETPLRSKPAFAILRGNLAPDGAVLKRSATGERFNHHRGPALVFDDYDDMLARIDLPDLPVTEQTVLVLRNAGPKGGPGMPEWGDIPIPKKLLEAGVTDMVRVSDARMSGTAFGTVVLHVAPEAAVGGPLAAVRDGDEIELDVENGALTLQVDASELSRRMADWRQPVSPHKRGFVALSNEHMVQAPSGCDLDFLQPRSKEEAVFVPPTVGRG